MILRSIYNIEIRSLISLYTIDSLFWRLEYATCMTFIDLTLPLACASLFQITRSGLPLNLLELL